ncbi:MAG: aminopeptidase P family protein [Frankiaceae bacterium]|nr:aminopeptidase P family protein [Frankiaceae bacterium]MBV9869267.1 aminopeptidase P family protein [Frankiaceae bacterium]
MVSHADRRSRLIRAFPDTIDALLITRLVNVRYLCGYSGSNGALLVTRDGSVVAATDGRYVTQMAQSAPDIECIEARAVGAALVGRARNEGITRVGIEAAHVTLATHEALREAAGADLALVATRPLVEPLRAVKDQAELATLRTACEITTAAFETVVSSLRPGPTERDVAWQLEAEMRERGASGPAFDTIVAFGPNSAIPHHQPTDRRLAPGDLVKVDFGALYDGYHADMTRTVAAAPVADWQRDLHQLVTEIQAECVAACVMGAVPDQLNTRAHRAIEAAGHRVAHGLGHGVGLEIHEDPFLTRGSTAAPLTANVAVTIEPGIYLPEQGGVRIEDTVVVGETATRSLTTAPRELLELS